MDKEPSEQFYLSKEECANLREMLAVEQALRARLENLQLSKDNLILRAALRAGKTKALDWFVDTQTGLCSPPPKPENDDREAQK